MPTPPIPSTRTIYVIQYQEDDDNTWDTQASEYPTLEAAKEWVSRWKAGHRHISYARFRYVKREITDTLVEEQ